jgi:tetratricopeptide (TPR) repeat protein
MRSPANRQDNNKNQRYSPEVTVATSSKSTANPTKGWHPKRHRIVSQPPFRSAAPKLSPADWETVMRQQALSEAQKGNRSEAIALFTQVLQQNPDSAQDYNNRGLVYFQDGQLDKAIADYDKALEISPWLDSVYNNRANYYAAQGCYMEAILDYDTAIDLNPGNIRAWINQGITFRDLKMYDRAIENFDLALCLGTGLEGHIYAERGRAYHLRGDWNCAIADYKRAIAIFSAEDMTNRAAVRLCSQVEMWLDELISPLF